MVNEAVSRLEETVSLGQARALIEAMAQEESLLLLAPPGVGKSDIVRQAAAAAGLPCRSLLGTQIAPEDVSGVPRILGERSVFCPPRVLLPEDSGPFCLFLDELPACNPDIQKAFYSLLLERRIGEFPLPRGTWVVAAGNRVEDRALVRSLSSALINRVLVLKVRVDFKEWMLWAQTSGIRSDILAYIAFQPDALCRLPPPDPRPYSTPRAWASLSRALDLADRAGITDSPTRRALCHGRVSEADAAIFSVMAEHQLEGILPLREYLVDPARMPREPVAAWFVVNGIRGLVKGRRLEGVDPAEVNLFLQGISQELRLAALVNAVTEWGQLGAAPAILATLKDVTGLT